MAQGIRRKSAGWWGLAVAILLLAYGIRLLVVEHGLPYIDHLDEPNFYLLANDWRGALDAYWRNDWLAGYPPGYIWLYSGALNVIDGIYHPNVHVDMGFYVRVMRQLGVWADVFTLSLVLVLARWLAGKRAALLAGLVYAVSSATLGLSVLALPDGFTVLWGVLCAAFSLHAVRRMDWRAGLLATTAGLLAVTFKYAVFPVLMMPGIVFVWLLWRKRQQALIPAAAALLLVIGAAYGLLVVYGAAGLENAEALQFRDSFATNFLNPTRWGYMFNGLFGTMGEALGLIALGAALGLLIRRQRITNGWLIGLVFLGAAGILAVIPAYLGGDPPRTYPIRYTWPGLALLIPAAAALIVRAVPTRVRGLWPVIVLVSVVIFAPRTLDEITELRKPNTFAIAQTWFDQTVPDGSTLWMDESGAFLSLSNYDRGFHSFKHFVTFFAREMPDWQGTPQDVNYVYLDPDGVQAWPRSVGWPPLNDLTLLKQIGDESTFGPQLRIYSPTIIPQPQQIVFTGSGTRLILWGYEGTDQEDMLIIKSFWQAPDGPPPADLSYSLYLTALDDPDTVVQQQDAQLGLRRTSTWDDPTERVEGGIAPFVFSPDLPSAGYQLHLVIYNSATGERLALENGETSLLIGVT